MSTSFAQTHSGPPALAPPALGIPRVGAPEAPEPVVRTGRSLLGPPDPDRAMFATVDGRHVLAMQAVVERYRAPATAIATYICGPTLAEDVVQDAFLSVWRASSTYCPERGSISNWVLRIVRNRAIDALRRDARQPRCSGEEELHSIPDPHRTDALVLAREQSRLLRGLLKTLPEDQARIITLAYFGELTHEEIAVLTGLPLGTIKGRLRLGLRRLRATPSTHDTGER